MPSIIFDLFTANSKEMTKMKNELTQLAVTNEKYRNILLSHGLVDKEEEADYNN